MIRIMRDGLLLAVFLVAAVSTPCTPELEQRVRLHIWTYQWEATVHLLKGQREAGCTLPPNVLTQLVSARSRSNDRFWGKHQGLCAGCSVDNKSHHMLSMCLTESHDSPFIQLLEKVLADTTSRRELHHAAVAAMRSRNLGALRRLLQAFRSLQHARNGGGRGRGRRKVARMLAGLIRSALV